eukprot:TRINITY_DN12040_c0_g2_i2.p1 TRINITY_DN12040_c0_g2~~TRINITY_DN12040_c0_g2_i2.p1  ORF type:complete len:183 (-),score=30.01 TRINITY_DN12040_c0_g2_i2:219-767(-)
MNPPLKKSIKKELQILNLLKGHPHVLQLYEVFETYDQVIIITDLLEGGDLYQKLKAIKKFSEIQTHYIFVQILDALKFLVQNNVVHRDLKLENILLTSTNLENTVIKIADFGLSDIFKKNGLRLLKTRCGTPGYMAPEVFYSKGYDDKVDIFSAGIILYLMQIFCNNESLGSMEAHLLRAKI